MLCSTARLTLFQVGGSLTGLAAGVALKTLLNVKSITILERYQPSNLEDQGAGIRIGSEVQEFYQRYAGVSPEAYSLGLSHYRALNTSGDVLLERDVPGSFASSWGQLFRTLKDAFLRNSTPCICTYRNGCRVENVVERNPKVDVVFRDDSCNEQTASADLVLGADGASSVVRQIFLPETKRTYAGYVIQRGLVPVELLSKETKAVLDGAGAFCWNNNSQILSYTVPGNGASVEEAGVYLNWGWYSEKTEEELASLMTDDKGVKHSFSLPIGGMRTEWVERIKSIAQQELPPQYAEVVQKTEKPFVQVITDSLAAENVFCDGKILLLGDAAAGQR